MPTVMPSISIMADYMIELADFVLAEGGYRIVKRLSLLPRNWSYYFILDYFQGEIA